MAGRPSLPSSNGNHHPPHFHEEKKVASAKEKSIQWGSRSVDIFEKIDQIGEGTYGQVYQARNKINGEIVALKKVRMDNEKEGFPITAIREIKILKELDHDNVVKLKEIVTSKATDYNRGKGSIYMVFEYMDHDLTGLMDSGLKWFSQAQIKCYMKQLLEGLHYCHKNNVLHRDIKGSNLLINNKGQLKLADFGLARPFNEQASNYTNRVITLWYRPPELLLGAVNYGPAIDMWSVGCILAELLAKKPIFPGRSEIDQLELTYKLCGTPNEENWPNAAKLAWWETFKPQKVYKRRIREAFKDFPPEALDLVDRLLTLDPNKRISASEALDSDYFWTEPFPPDPSTLPKYPPSHEFQAKKRRQQGASQQDPTKRQRVEGASGPVHQQQHHPQHPGQPPHKYPIPPPGQVPHNLNNPPHKPPYSHPAPAQPQKSNTNNNNNNNNNPHLVPSQSRPNPHNSNNSNNSNPHNPHVHNTANPHNQRNPNNF